MKKLSFILAMVLGTGMVMAQNTAVVTQYGGNIGQILQTGMENDATILQGTSLIPVSNNLNQPTGWKQGSYIEQIGDENNANVTVRTSGNGTSIYQEGNENDASQEVGSFNHATTDLTIMGLDIEQFGDNNAATQRTFKSFGSTGIKPMIILQDGNYNIADQVSVGGNGQTQRIKQVGDNNNNPVQSGNTLNLSPTTLADPRELNFQFTSQSGSVTPPLTQYSNQMFGTAIMNVEGNNNNTYQFQEYSVWSLSGDNDVALNLVGDGNDVVQGQLGEYNFSDIVLDGDGNVISTSQLGDHNTINIDLLAGSNNNVVGVEQTGDGHDATVLQSGIANFAKVIQQP